MDIFSHALLGAATAQLGFRQKIGRDASWVAAGAAVAADLDVLAGPILSLVGAEPNGFGHLETHRGLTHSLLAAPVIALLIAGLWWWARQRGARRAAADGPAGRPPSFSLLYACTLLAALTHPFLDWCTSYGTQLLAPLTDKRFAADVVPIIDIIFTPILAAMLLAVWIVRKAAREPASPRPGWAGPAPRATLAIGWAGLFLAMGYLGAGAVMHGLAVQRVRALVPAGQTLRRADAYPAIGTIFLWRGVAETDWGWYVARVRPLGPAPVLRDACLVRRVRNPWVEKALASLPAKRYEWFAMGRVRAALEERDGLHIVELHDMRYGLPLNSPESLWPLRITLNDAGEVVQAERIERHRLDRGWATMRRIWQDLWSDGRDFDEM